MFQDEAAHEQLANKEAFKSCSIYGILYEPDVTALIVSNLFSQVG
jgi:hypothetical protein